MANKIPKCSIECPDESFEDIFSCSSCKKPFKGYIYYVDGKNVCKACCDRFKGHAQAEKRNEGLEKILRYSKMVCGQNGCTEKIPYYDLEDHRKIYCEYRKVNCVIPKCPWQGKIRDQNEHYGNHNEVSKNPMKVSLTTWTNVDKIRYIIDGNLIFVVNIIINAKESTISYRVSQHDINCHPGVYSVTFVGPQNSELFQIRNLITLGSRKSSCLKINIADVKRVIGGNKTILICVIDVAAKDMCQKMFNDKIFKDFECPICMTFMEPPIYLCNSGHSFCNGCRLNLKQCPICSVKMSTMRNFALEAISKEIEHPCCYYIHGCSEILKGNDIKAHEKNCPFKQEM